MTLAPLDLGAWLGVCAAALLLAMAGCRLALGGSLRTSLQDLLMIALTESTIVLAFRSPMDLAHLHGSLLRHWSVGLGTGLAVVGILLNHLADSRRPRPRRMR